jgi:hypothetical protein
MQSGFLKAREFNHMGDAHVDKIKSKSNTKQIFLVLRHEKGIMQLQRFVILYSDGGFPSIKLTQ